MRIKSALVELRPIDDYAELWVEDIFIWRFDAVAGRLVEMGLSKVLERAKSNLEDRLMA